MRPRHVDVVLVRPAADGQEDLSGAAQLDDLSSELPHGAERCAGETEQTVPRLDADAGGGTPGAHPAYLEGVALLRDAEAEEAPGEVVGMGGAPRRRRPGRASRAARGRREWQTRCPAPCRRSPC